MRESRDGETVGITLRLRKRTLNHFQERAVERNLHDLQNGGRGRLTAQDVMREHLDAHVDGSTGKTMEAME